MIIFTMIIFTFLLLALIFVDAFLDLLHDSGPVSPKAVQVDLSDQSSQSSRVDLSSPMHRSYSTEQITPTTRFDFDDLEVHAPSTPS